MRQFVKNMAERYPHFMGGADESFINGDPSISGAAFLSRVISSLNYTPSSIDLLPDHKGLAKHGVLTDAVPRSYVNGRS
ncbi:hypothetical protein [Massilia sp. TWR1-2-2]|uniref:hypothetical protein n=1 Tax=Massilia sp. TWR1-2-2 TaxID=2804584 RepID=UPI003CF56045